MNETGEKEDIRTGMIDLPRKIRRIGGDSISTDVIDGGWQRELSSWTRLLDSDRTQNPLIARLKRLLR